MELLKDILFHDQLIEILEKIIDKRKSQSYLIIGLGFLVIPLFNHL